MIQTNLQPGASSRAGCVYKIQQLCASIFMIPEYKKTRLVFHKENGHHNSHGSVIADGGNNGNDDGYVLVVIVLLLMLIVFFVGGHDIDGDDMME